MDRGPHVSAGGTLKAAAAELRRVREKCDRAKALCAIARGQVLLDNKAEAAATLDRIMNTLQWSTW
jgi:hypothetical protein